jgi:hypothetical protein
VGDGPPSDVGTAMWRARLDREFVAGFDIPHGSTVSCLGACRGAAPRSDPCPDWVFLVGGEDGQRQLLWLGLTEAVWGAAVRPATGRVAVLGP